MEHVGADGNIQASAAVSAHVDPYLAAEDIVEQLSQWTGSARTPDLCTLFVGGDHAEHAGEIAKIIRRAVEPAVLIGGAAAGVVGPGTELDDRPGISCLAMRLPNTRLTTFSYRELPHATPDNPAAMANLAAAIGARRDLRAILLFADPYSTPTPALVNTLSAVHTTVPGLDAAPVLGGLLDAAGAPGQNTLLLNDGLSNAGAVGLAISGDIQIDTLVSQGCRPIGEPFVVTSAKRNVLLRLGGKRAIDAVRDVVNGLDEDDRTLLSNGLHIGRVVNEHKDRLGRGDFVVRNVLGVDQDHGAVAVAEQMRVGQRVQFHLRDAATAALDLELLLQAQRLRGIPHAGILSTCSGRGSNLFGTPDHDAEAVARWMSDRGPLTPPPFETANNPDPTSPDAQPQPDDTPPALETLAPTAGDGVFPLAGFFAGGEFGPINNRSYVHTQAASLALFREPGT